MLGIEPKEKFDHTANPQPAIALVVIKQATANPLDVSKAVHEAVSKISASLPNGMKVGVAYDTTVYINESFDNVYETILEAVVLVVYTLK